MEIKLYCTGFNKKAGEECEGRYTENTTGSRKVKVPFVLYYCVVIYCRKENVLCNKLLIFYVFDK